MDPKSAAPAAIAASSSSPASPVSTATPVILPLEGGTDHELVFAAAQEASGRPNGGVYTKDNGVGVPYLRIRLPQYDYIVMIRDVYTEIYAWVAARLEEMRAVHGAGGSSPAVRLVLYGQPGTGKSSTLPVLQAALLEQSQPVFYHVLGSEDVYLFNDVYSRKMSFTEFASFRPARPVVCLLDTPTKPYGGQEDAMWRKPNTIFVLASSPRQTPDKTLEKAQGETHYWTMPAAGLQEIENVDLLRRHVQLTGCTYITTKTFHLHRYTPSDTCTAGHAFEAKDAYVRMTASQERVDANNAPPAQRPTAVPDEEEEEEPEGAVSISIGGDSFDVSPGPDWTPQELFELLGPSFRLAFDRTLRKGDDPKSSLRNFLKLALVNNEESLKKIVTILQGARLDLREPPTGYHQIAYELPSGPQPSAGDPSIERVIPTRFLLAVVRERVQELQGVMPEAVVLKLLPLPHARVLLYKTRGIRCVETLESPLEVSATPSAVEPDLPAWVEPAASTATATSTSGEPLPSGLSPALQTKLTQRATLQSISARATQVCSTSWGQANGGVLRNEATGKDVPFVRLRIHPYNHLVLVRDVYVEVLEWIKAGMDKLRGEIDPDPIYLVLCGQTGVGKSSAIPYLMAAWWEQRQPLFYHVLGSAKIVLFDGPKSYQMSVEDFAGLTFTEPVLCLIDTPDGPVTSPPLSNAISIWHTSNVLFVVALSSTATLVKTLWKAPGAAYYWTLPCAGKEEVKNVLLLQRQFQDSVDQSDAIAGSLRLSEHTRPTAVLSGGAAYNAGARLGPATGVNEVANFGEDDEELELEESEDALDIDVGRDCFSVEPGETFTPLELFRLLGPSFGLCFHTQLRKGTGPGDELRRFIKPSSLSLGNVTEFLSGIAFHPSGEPGGLHLLIYEVPDGPQPSGNEPSSARVIPTRFLWAAIRERFAVLTMPMLR